MPLATVLRGPAVEYAGYLHPASWDMRLGRVTVSRHKRNTSFTCACMFNPASSWFLQSWEEYVPTTTNIRLIKQCGTDSNPPESRKSKVAIAVQACICGQEHSLWNLTLCIQSPVPA